MSEEQNICMIDNRGQTVQDFIVAFTIIIIMFTLVLTYTFTFIPTTAISSENVAEQQATALVDELRERTLHASPQNGPTSQYISPECTVAFFTKQNVDNCRPMDDDLGNVTGVSPRTSTYIALTHQNGSVATVNEIYQDDKSVTNATEPLERGDVVQSPRVVRDTLVSINNDTYKIVVRIQ